VRRIAFIALVAAAGCGEVSELASGPSDRFYFPTGMAVHAGKLVVASSNFDLRYDEDTGGTLISVDPSANPATLQGTLNLRSFTGELAIAAPPECAIRNPELGAIAVLPVRGVGSLYQVRVDADGALACDDCATQIGTPDFADPFTVGLACGPGIARAYIGYLRSGLGEGWITQIDLTLDPTAEGAVQHRQLGTGQVRGFAYDAGRQRLYATQVVTGAGATLRFVDVGDGCRFDATDDTDPAKPRCATGVTVAGAIPNGLEPREIALSSPGAPSERAYVTTRIYDPALAAAAGMRIGDFDGLLLVGELVETLGGELDFELLEQIEMGYGASSVVVLGPGVAGQRDVVAALGADDGVLLLHDDESGEDVYFGRDAEGAPLIGHGAFGLAVDAEASASGIGRLYVGSFEDDFVTAVDVPLDDVRNASLVREPPNPLDPGAVPAIRRITGGVTP
jgi:hypothetical protein